jgi:hypothetical protein
MNRPLGFVSISGATIAGIVLVGVLAATLALGPILFTAGSLNAVSKGRVLGGVDSHARLTSCDSCHTAPWNPQTMADRCVVCHTDVGAALVAGTGLHGHLPGGATSRCVGCHSEHHGPSGALTLTGPDFPHALTGFALTGRHATLACERCHPGRVFQNAPTDCYGCHANSDKHNGAFGKQCGQCHSTDTWANARFDHTVFPLDHGSNEQLATCQTCHPTDVTTYTCFGCHRHTPANVVNGHEGRTLAELADCIRCHQGGRTNDN